MVALTAADRQAIPTPDPVGDRDHRALCHVLEFPLVLSGRKRDRLVPAIESATIGVFSPR
ncbi:MAG: hypothetical protein CMJ59_22085 [Planctomycetaceae bacterium]|nr:hypothetical protein [Planctomycetaceae bacterium]